MSPATNFLYVGKRRRASDWPDTSKGDQDETPLEIDGELIEPMYIAGVSNSTFAAFLRSSGGPSWEAVQHWIMSVLGVANQPWSLELRPYVRADYMERLAQAEGVSKLHMKFDPGSLSSEGSESEIMKAVSALQGGSSAVTVEVEVSFGRSMPGDGASEEHLRALREAVGRPGKRQLRATVLRPTGNGELAKDKIDFLKDRVTFSVEVGNDPDDRPTPEAIMKAMSEATASFTAMLRESDMTA